MPQRISTQLRESLGLTMNEAKIYLAALELGSESITKIAKKARMARTSAYSIVEHLLERGFLMEFKKGKQTLYVATPPEKLVERLHEQEEQLHKVIPALEKLGRKNRIEPQIRVIPGEEGIKTVLREILAEKRAFRAMVAVQDIRALMADYYEDFMAKRAAQRLKVHLLTDRTPYSLKLKKEDGKVLRTTRFLPDHEPIHTAAYVFGDKVAWISVSDDPPISVIIEDAAIAKTHALSFDLLWRMAQNH